MKPPWIAEALLLAVAGDSEAEFVAGDLQEEFAHICERRGASAGRRWYCRQVARSAASLLAMRARSGEWTEVLLGAFLGVALPLILLDRLWQFVYSQIPLKDGLDRAPGFFAVNLICLLLTATMSGAHARSARRAAVAAASAATFGALAISAAPETTPGWYTLAVLLTAPAASILPFLFRRTTR